MSEFVALLEPVALRLLGSPSERNGNGWRYGTRGSLSLDLTKGVWHDHEANHGGGVLDLVQRERGGTREDAVAWLKREGFLTERADRGRIIATYDYTDEGGKLLFQVCRFEPKDFRQRKPNGSGWDWKLGDTRRVVYRLPEVIEAIAQGQPVFVVEGEKDADRLRALGVPATCNPGGANKWRADYNGTFRDADVVIVSDNDDSGRAHTDMVATNLRGAASRVRVLALPDLPEKGDVSDWLDAGGTVEDLWRLVEGAPGAAPSIVPDPPLPFIDMSRWDAEQPPPREWAVPDRYPLRQCALFSGEGAVGKGIVQLHLSVAHVLGRDWFGTLPEPGPAIFLDAEDDSGELHRRLAAIVAHYGVRFDEVIKGGLHLLSFAGRDAVLATVSRSGKIEPTPLYQQLVQAAADIKPKMIGIANAANVFAGSEIDRSQVQQFVSLLTRLAIVADGTVVLISHPSLTGINTETGLSGTTAWHNSVRARAYMRGVKPEPGEQSDNDLREIMFKKNNYGPLGETVVVRYDRERGLFLPVRGMSNLERARRDADADALSLDQFRRNEMNVSKNPHAANYAPRIFARMPEAKKHGLITRDLEDAMHRLLAAGKIRVEQYGRPSEPRYRLVPNG